MSNAAEFFPSLTPAAAVWLDGLRSYVREERTRRTPEARLARLRPPVTTTELELEQELIYQYFKNRLGGVPRLVAGSNRFGSGFPAIVITTSPAGLLAEQRLYAEPALAGLRQISCWVTEVEYRFWCHQQPDPDCSRHVNHWAWVKTRVPVERAAEFVAYPIEKHERYWLFRNGVAGCGPADHYSCQLFRSDGQAVVLLEQDFREGVTGL